MRKTRTALGLAFDRTGNLYAATDNAKPISRITPAGTVTALATVGGTAPVFIVQVPEPGGAPAALCAAGVWVARRRTRPRD